MIQINKIYLRYIKFNFDSQYIWNLDILLKAVFFDLNESNNQGLYMYTYCDYSKKLLSFKTHFSSFLYIYVFKLQIKININDI